MLIFDLKMFIPFVNGVKLPKFGLGRVFLCIFGGFCGKTEGGSDKG